MVEDGLLAGPVRVLLQPLAVVVLEGVGALLGREAHDPDARVQALHRAGEEADHGRRLAHARGPRTMKLR